MGEGKKAGAKGAAEQVKAELKRLRDTREEIRKTLDEVEKAIHGLKAAPISLDDWGLYLRAHIASIGRRYPVKMLSLRLMSPEFGSSSTLPENQRPWEELERPNALNLHNSSRVFFDEMTMPALCALLGDQLHAFIMAGVKAELGSSWGNDGLMPVAMRVEMVKQLKESHADLAARRQAIQAEIDDLLGVLEN